MVEMEMVERVAKAICNADPFAPEPDAPIYIGMKSAKAWEARLPMARAAIEAMREPDDSMILAAHDPFDGASVFEIRCIWRAMIDAALTAPKERG